ncbi:uncharacterized protein A4U43_C04F25320 [Asparagus officinalis]|uniref:Uncharacterized protein n=1 Tax=Asparagus officinalis TaxID=4686 RepID=A0A5P1F3L7_ASPOF|nr:uncharacterized protein A4U43_C04F25320 [Asparagus officinalis]
MGFPLGYSELLLPKLLLQLVFFLGFIRRLISWAFDFMGLGDLLLDSPDTPWPEPCPPAPARAPVQARLAASSAGEITPCGRVPDWLGPIADSLAASALYEFDAANEVRQATATARSVFAQGSVWTVGLSTTSARAPCAGRRWYRRRCWGTLMIGCGPPLGFPILCIRRRSRIFRRILRIYIILRR